MHWKAKIAAQFVLAHLPFGERLNNRLQVMNGRFGPERIRKVFVDRVAIFERLANHIPLKDAVIVEVGTGWELLDPMLMFIFGAKAIYTYDHVRHLRFPLAKKNIAQMWDLRDLLLSQSANLDRLKILTQATNLEQLLSTANVHYVAPGDAALTGLPNQTVDLFFSISVLEHVPPRVLTALIAESKRILKPSGLGFHIIDPGDHYAEFGTSKVNFLQYSDRIWDFFVQNKISYHNRLRAKEFIEAFEKQGAIFQTADLRTEEQSLAALDAGLLIDQRFSAFTKQELAVHYLEVVHSF
jgi:hypothetical protein